MTDNFDKRFLNVPVEVRVLVGSCSLSVKEIINLKKNSIISLDKGAEDLVDIFIGERLIGKGELEEMDNAGGMLLAVRIVDIIGLDDC